jgi:hypothetical protein
MVQATEEWNCSDGKTHTCSSLRILGPECGYMIVSALAPPSECMEMCEGTAERVGPCRKLANGKGTGEGEMRAAGEHLARSLLQMEGTSASFLPPLCRLKK